MEENYEIDSHVLDILERTGTSMSMRLIEAHLLVAGFFYNTFDVQRSVRRLILSKKVELTGLLQLKIAKE